MKYLILLIAISIYCFANDKIERFENTYIKKAEQLKATRDKSVKEADVKFVSDSRKLAEAYIKVLKKEQIAIVKTGDLEGALKIKAKIIEIEKILKNQVTRPEIVQPQSVSVINKDINTIGSKLDYRIYRWSLSMRISFLSDGKVLKAGGNGVLKPVGIWKEVSPGIIQWSMYKFHFANDLSYYYIEKGGVKYAKKIPYLGMLKNKLRDNITSKHFWTKETITNTTWICYDGEGKKTGVEVTLLADGKFNVTNSPGWRSYWRWGFTDGCIIYGVSQVNGCKVTFAKNGGSTTSFYNIGRKESYTGQWILKK